MAEAFVLACCLLMGDDRFHVRENAEMVIRAIVAKECTVVLQLKALAPVLPVEAGRRAAAIAEELSGVEVIDP